MPAKTDDQIAAIARAGALASRILAGLVRECVAGAVPADLADMAHAWITRSGATPVMMDERNARGERFPAAVSVCVNDRVGAGVPGPEPLRPGDVVSVDVALALDGWCADVATATVVAGGPGADPDPGRDAARLERAVADARALLDAFVAGLRPGALWARLTADLAGSARARGLTLAREYGAHGVGRSLHEGPALAWDSDCVLRPGTVLAVEPVFLVGSGGIVDPGEGDGGWGARTADGGPAIHEERTVAVGASGPLVLTPVG